MDNGFFINFGWEFQGIAFNFFNGISEWMVMAME